MFDLSYFDKEFTGSAIDISGKRYSDSGMMYAELSSLTGIPRDILCRYDDWYILDGEFYYFKKRGKFEELFMSELARECRVRCVEFLLAMDKGTLGVISKLYREKSKSYCMYSVFCRKYFDYSPNGLSWFKLSSEIAFGEEKASRLMDDVFNLICFDLFSGQWDRMEYNFFFECSDNDVRIAPLCDNEMIFTSSSVYTSPFGVLDLGEDMTLVGNLPHILSYEKSFYNKLASCLDINVSDILNRTCEKYKIDISDDDKEKILGYFDDRKMAIEHTLRLSRSSR